MAGWYILILCSSLLGDTTILVASIKYKAFELPKIVVTIIQHLAVCDLTMALFYLLPSIVSLIANGWVLGSTLCYINIYVCYYGITVGSFLIATITTSKYLLLRYPLRGGIWFKRNAQKICVGVWLFCLYTPISFFWTGRSDVSFDFRTYSCMYGFSSPAWKILNPCLAVLGGALPNTTIVVTTILLLKKARKAAKGNLRWQGIATVLLTVVVYMSGFTLFTLYHMLEPFLEKNPSMPTSFDAHFFKIAWVFLSFNITGNFFVYSFTVESFQNFLKTKILKSKVASEPVPTATSQGKCPHPQS